MDQDGTWHGGVPWSRPHCARWGPTSPLQKGAEPPIFGPFLLWPNSWMHQDATWYGRRLQPRRLCVRWGPSYIHGDPAPYPKRDAAPQFLAHVYCGHTVAWIKMPLGMEIGLGVRDIVLDGQPPIFGQCPLWPNGLMNYDTTWYGDRPRLRRLCVRWGPSYIHEKAHPPPNFWSISIVPIRLDV